MSELLQALARAEAALDAKKPADALAPMLQAWREWPSPALADLVDRVTALLPAPKPLPGRSGRVRQKHWARLMERRDPADVPRALSELCSRSWREAPGRLESLAQWPRDPRLALGLLALVERAPLPGRPSAAFCERVLGVVEATGDPRAAPRLDCLGSRLASRVLRVRSLLEKPLPPRPELEAPLARLASRLGAASSAAKSDRKTTEGFLAAIHAALDDDAPRLVFADWLTQQGDPRGELIALQCLRRGAPTPAQARREKALLERHGSDWLGPLSRVLLKDGLRFERGFPAAGRLELRSTRMDDVEGVVAGVVGDPTWTTFRELTIGSWAGDAVVDLLAHPTMRSLRVARGLALGQLLALSGRERMPPFEELGLRWDRELPAEGLDALAQRLPGLRALSVLFSVPAAAQLLASRLASGLRSLELQVAHGAVAADLGAWWAQAGRLSGLERLAVVSGLDTSAWRLSFARSGGGALDALEAEPTPRRGKWYVGAAPLGRLLASLPDGAVKRATVRGTDQELEMARGALARFGAKVAFLPHPTAAG